MVLRGSTVPKVKHETLVLGMRVAQSGPGNKIRDKCSEVANRIEELHPQDLCQGEVLAKKPWFIVSLKNWPKSN